MSNLPAASTRPRRNKRLPEHQKLIDDVRQLRAAWLDAVRHEMAIECRPGERGYAAYQRAVRASEAVEKRLERLGDSILARRVKRWDDVVLLAELAAHDANEAGVLGVEGGKLVYTDRAQEALAALFNGVLQLGCTRTDLSRS